MANEREPVMRGRPKNNDFHYVIVCNEPALEDRGVNQHMDAQDNGYQVDEKFGKFIRYKKPMSEHKKDLQASADAAKRMLRTSVAAADQVKHGESGVSVATLDEVDIDR